MHHPGRILTIIIISACLASILPGPALSQSGRGRPKVPGREAPTPPPPLVKVPAATAVVKKEQSGNVSRFELRNGMTVIISEQHAVPLVAVAAAFKTGSYNGPARKLAVSSALAQALLSAALNTPRGTDSLQAIGALAGADAGYDCTLFHIVTPAAKVNTALAVQEKVIRSPALSPELISRLAPVAAEAEPLPSLAAPYQSGSRLGDPSRIARAELFQAALGTGPVGQAPAVITREQVEEFYRSVSRPENLIITVVGDVLLFNTLVEIQRLYGDFGGKEVQEAQEKSAGAETGTQKPANKKVPQTPAGTPEQKMANKQPAPNEPSKIAPAAQAQPAQPQISAPAESNQPRLSYKNSRADISQSIINIGIRLPDLTSNDRAAAEMISSLLARGRGSRLLRPLLDAQPTISHAETEFAQAGKDGVLTFQMWAPPNMVDKAESELFRELDRLRRETPSESEVARARGMLEKAYIDLLSTHPGRGVGLARAEASGDLRALLDYRNRIRAVSGADLQRVAAKFFTLTNLVIHEVEPFSAAPRTFNAESFTAAIASWVPGFGQSSARVASDVDPNLPEVVPQGVERSTDEQAVLESIQPIALKDFSSLNGPRSFVFEDRSQPKVSVAIMFQVGKLAEDEASSGITELMLRSILYGTPRRTAVQVTHEIEQLGADVYPVVEQDFFGIILSVTSRNAEHALKLLRDIMEEPAFRDGDVARARVAQVGAIRQSRDSLAGRTRELLFQSIFPAHSYALAPHGREDVVGKLTVEQLRAWYESSIKRQLPLAMVVGDTQGSALVSSVIAEGFRRREFDRTFKARVPVPKAGDEKAEQRRTPWSALSIGFAGPKGDSADLAILELIEAVMNGPGGRLQSVAREASLRSEALLTSGVIYAEVVTPAGDEQRARAAVLSEIGRITSAGLTAEELDAARARALTFNLAGLQWHEKRALEYAFAVFNQRKPAEVDSFAESVSKITAEDVKRVASTYLKPAGASAAIVRGTQTATPDAPKQY